MMVIRPLISCAHSNGGYLMDCWDIVLATLQHLMWILGLKPTTTGMFRTIGDTTGSASEGATSTGLSNTVILTTAASSELPDLVGLVFEASRTSRMFC